MDYIRIKIDIIFPNSSKITIYDVDDLKSLMSLSKWQNNSIYDFLDSNDIKAFLAISCENKEFKAFIDKIDIVHYFSYLDMILNLCAQNEFKAFIDVLNQDLKKMYGIDGVIEFQFLVASWIHTTYTSN